jgi:hypothetical protein
MLGSSTVVMPTLTVTVVSASGTRMGTLAA